MVYRSAFFLSILILLALPGLGIVWQFVGIASLGLVDTNFGGWTTVAIIKALPLVAEDASLLGQFAPASIALALAVFAPRKSETTLIAVSFVIAALGWLLYLYLSIVLKDGTPVYDAVVTTIEGDVTPPRPGMIVLQNAASSLRVFYLVVGATVLGIKLKGDKAQ